MDERPLRVEPEDRAIPVSDDRDDYRAGGVVGGLTGAQETPPPREDADTQRNGPDTMALKTERLLGRDFRKIQPKLRMIARARDDVNLVRSDFASALRVGPAVAPRLDDAPETRVAGPVPKKKLKTPRMRETSPEMEASVFVSWQKPGGRESEARSLDNERISPDGAVSTATIKLSQAGDLAEHEDVGLVELGEPLRAPDAVVSEDQARRPALNSRRVGADGRHRVLIGIIDVGGFDFSHEDFLHPATRETRWVAIWDQGGTVRPAPAGFGYGSEILKRHMDDALIASTRDNSLPAWALEPQSQMTVGSHGTHVASIAAGNRGICRDAYLAGVLISLPQDEVRNRRLSFYDSTRVAHAVDYLFELAEDIRRREGLDTLPVSINISLGTNGGAHDASNAISRWIDSALITPGRCVTVAAGNAGQEKAEAPDDFGFINGRVHTEGRIEARGLDSDIEWIVVGNGIADVSENELELWYSGADRFAVSVTPPGMPTVGPIRPREYLQNHRLPDNSMLSVYNELYHPANGLNYIAIYLSPFLKQNPVVGVRPGRWKVRLHGVEIRDGRYHGWIERDDPRRRGVGGGREFWNFPSFFAKASNADRSSVNSLACGQRVISVANLHEADQRIHISSSQGPTRDGRHKPDIAAPGTDIVAARGFASESDGRWVAMTGTSMASPRVSGVVGLMLQRAPQLTSAQICGIMQRTAQPLPGRNFSWADDSGYGVLHETACLREAEDLNKRVKVER